MPDYAKRLGDKLECRYHVIGSHGGAWIYKVTISIEQRYYRGDWSCTKTPGSAATSTPCIRYQPIL